MTEIKLEYVENKNFKLKQINYKNQKISFSLISFIQRKRHRKVQKVPKTFDLRFSKIY
jgi:hypothetical protein